MPTPDITTTRVIGTIRQNTQKSFDSRWLGPCDAYYRLVHEKKTTKFTATAEGTGSGRTSPTEKFKVTGRADATSRVGFDVRTRRNTPPRISGGTETVTLPPDSVVMWHTGTIGGPRVTIDGVEGQDTRFTNKKLNRGDMFGHTFLFKGTYEYDNGKTGTAQKKGAVKVKAVKKAAELHDPEQFKPVIVKCTPQGFDPQQVEVVTGQTILWVAEAKNCVIVSRD